MSDFLSMRSFLNQSEPTVAKVRRDGENMYCYARYVIVLNEEGNIVETIDRPSDYIGNFFVILAPVIYKGEFLPLSVILEIGFSRSVPYQQFEKWFGSKKISIQSRRPVAKLTNRKIISLLGIIGSSLQKITDEDTSHRLNSVHYTKMTPDGHLAKNGNVIFCGKFITIPSSEEILVYVSLSIDIHKRMNGHLQEMADITKEKLRKLKYAYYPGNQIKRFEVAKERALVLREAGYSTFFASIIREKVGRDNSKCRSLFEQIIERFDIEFVDNDLDVHYSNYPNLDKKWSRIKKELISSFGIDITTHPKREIKKKQKLGNGPSHATGCIRVEVLPSREAIEKKHKINMYGIPEINFRNGIPGSKERGS